MKKLNLKSISKKIAGALLKISDVRAIVLYGSFARGDFGPKSDIDLFIITGKKDTIDQVEKEIVQLEQEISKSIQPTIRTIEELEKTDTGLLQNVFQEGKVLYTKEPLEISAVSLLEQKPYIISSFNLNSLSQKQKAAFNRELYEQTKGKYTYKGLLKELGGEKISPGCVMIPHNKEEMLLKFFRKYRVKFIQTKIWKS
ncbi:hypothetical protein AUJ66_05885 [Candidatus Desantisbacteria bacterium CG1_02_38_46]|uniref:Polymerase beta nucleotidyltransferase domain-containing protein n=3 Tax=unclassified Candidatus Desantisiibacteriota TaxID=3106372 RepID=A0A2H9PEE7_9BACT|nr:MAG: hypothetical protein AUJ66_05885 [Candidatus Desantisbacteria bacterium CG1_02_38_46]PIU52193.1 MAG: hypothetical protein COS91_00460 [Candidatus Desantisbacteria bacterium CG07_land_8_20_14_0_80_39_15]PIZ17189.1 MAG: hypothetical protein COY51_00865 [Candidatus Desantisbacteria bacterium CG_4_10_14_0_8_um_filter_39_17]